YKLATDPALSMYPSPPRATLFPYTTLFRSEGDEYSYRCGPDYQFPREHVINNRIPGVLYRGKGWTGWLVGLSWQPLPCSIKGTRSEEHTSELQSPYDIVCRLLLEKKNTTKC